MTPSSLSRIKFFCRFSEGAGIAVFLIGLAALCGWLLDAGMLKSFYPGLLPMRPNTAVCFVLLGLGTWLSQDRFDHRRWRVIARGCGWLVAAVAMVTLAEYILARNLGIDQLLFAKETGAAYVVTPGRITGMSSLVLLFLGLALAGLDAKTAWGLRVTQMFGFLAGIGSMLAVCGYAYSLWDVFGPSVPFAAMSLPAACASVLAWAGIFCARPERGLMSVLISSGMGGTMARVLLPTAVLVPLFIDLVTVPKERGGPFSLETNSALNMAVTITLLASLVLFAARNLNREDAERKRVEGDLRASEEKFRELAENINDVFWISSPNMTKTYYVSPAYETVWGRSTADSYNNANDWLEAVHPEDRSKVLECFQTLSAEQPSVSIEFRIVRPDGTVRWIHDRGFQVCDPTGRVVRTTGVSSDITERKQAELALRWNETELQTTLESTADGILAVNNEGQVVKANRRFFDLWRIPQSLRESRDDQALLAFVGSQLSDPAAFLKKVQALYKLDAVDMDTISFKDERVFERYSSPMMIDGNVAGRVWSFRDITERKQAEKERERLIAELRGALAEVKTLSGLIPICAGCKKIRDDKGYWSQVESYISLHTDATFTHGLCPDCIRKYYPELGEGGTGDSPQGTA